MRVGVLVSGAGSILEALLADDIPVAVVLSDRPCRALDIAEAAGVKSVLVDRRLFGSFGAEFDRVAFTDAVVEALTRHGVEVVAMAGFGTVLAQSAHDAYPGRILNTHPALLPAFPGWHAVQDALAAGVSVTGCTVHLATLEVDAGPVLAQESVPVYDDDDVESLHERIKECERQLYPQTIRRFVAQLEVEGEARQQR